MMFWIVAGLMAVAATAALIVPLLRGRHKAVYASDYDVEVYKDQISELDREFAAGHLSVDQATAARTEIARRLLAADNRRKADGGNADDSMRPRRRLGTQLTALVIAIALPGVALTIYARLGTPGMPGVPFASRSQAPPSTQDAAEGMNLETLAVRLANRLKSEPEDLEGWLLLARTYLSLNRYGEAAKGYEQALRLNPADNEIKGAYGETLTLAAEGNVTPTAQRIFEELLRSKPDDVRARYYIGLASLQNGSQSEALDRWAALIADSPADASWLPIVRRRAEEAARALGHNVASALPNPLPAATDAASTAKPAERGPTAADVAAAAAMSPEERAQMIEGMIEGLAARLEENPREFDGWLRLIRAYAVIKQLEKAEAALDKALDVFAKAPFPRRQLAALGRELGLDVPTDTAARGPTAEQVEAAQQLSSTEQTTMIEGMVASLAARLEDEPNDTAGWIRLARSYEVLKRPADMRNALARAANLNPGSIDILLFYARALRAGRGGQPSTESIAVIRKVLRLAPDNVEALWFVAQAETANGNSVIAKTLLKRALAQLPEISADRAQVERAIEALDGG